MDQSKIDASIVVLAALAEYPKEHGDGVLIEGVVPGCAADGELFPGDRIVSIDGAPIDSYGMPAGRSGRAVGIHDHVRPSVRRRARNRRADPRAVRRHRGAAGRHLDDQQLPLRRQHLERRDRRSLGRADVGARPLRPAHAGRPHRRADDRGHRTDRPPRRRDPIGGIEEKLVAAAEAGATCSWCPQGNLEERGRRAPRPGARAGRDLRGRRSTYLRRSGPEPSSARPVIGLRRLPSTGRRTPGLWSSRSDRHAHAGTASAHHHRRRGAGGPPRGLHRALGVLRRRPVVPRGRPVRRLLDASCVPRSSSALAFGLDVLRAPVREPVDRPPHHAPVPGAHARSGDHRALPDGVRALRAMAAAAVRARDRVLRRVRRHDPVADVPAVAELRRIDRSGSPNRCSAAIPAFYVFGLPWLQYIQGWLFSSLVGVTLLTAVAHYLWGGIRPQAQGFGEKVTPQVKAHLSVLLGLIMLMKAWGYYLGQFDLLTSTRGRRGRRLVHRRQRAAARRSGSWWSSRSSARSCSSSTSGSADGRSPSSPWVCSRWCR